MLSVTLFGIIFTGLFTVFVDVQGEFRLSAGRIAGGKTASDGAYPFMVSVQRRVKLFGEEFWGHDCGGSILNRVWILTACHCVASTEDKPLKYKNPSEFRVVAGVTNYNSKKSVRQEVLAGTFFAHPQCNRSGKPPYTYYDSGLIKLQSPLEYTTRVQPLKLFNTQPDVAVRAQNRLQEAHVRCVSPGWGLIGEIPEVKLSSRLNYATQILHTAAECHKRLCDGNTLNHEGGCADFDKIEQMCVTSESAQVCVGDSGGPLVCNGFVFGVVSQTSGCKVNGAQIYAGIATILKVVNEHVPTKE